MNLTLKKINYRLLHILSGAAIFILIPFLVNCGADLVAGEPPAEPSGAESSIAQALAAVNFQSGTLWADAPGPVTPGGITPAASSRVSLDVREANILDVLSVLSVKMGAQVIFLEQPTTVTFKSSNLSALTTFQLLLQKEDLDYLVVSNHYVVGDRERLYDDFYNRLILTNYDTRYISVQTLQELIDQLNIPVQNVTVDINTQEIWVQGTPMALSKFLELIETVDRRQNAAFDTGGERVVRMPVARAAGANAVAALWAQQDLLEDLISNAHTDPVVDGSQPRIDADELYWMVSADISGNPDPLTANDEIRILWVEGTPDHIALVKQMIGELSDIQGP
jgi:hypothetical protein